MLLSLLSKRSLEVDSRDAYGFVLRPQHVQTYREYADIYLEEEEERSAKWKNFLERHMQSAVPCLTKDKKDKVKSECSHVEQETSAEEQNKRLQVIVAEAVDGTASEEEPKETSVSELKTFNDWTSEEGKEATLDGEDIQVKGHISSEKEHTVTREAEYNKFREGTNSKEEVENKASEANCVPRVEYSESLQDEGTELKGETASREQMEETLEAKAIVLKEEVESERSEEGNTSSIKSELVSLAETGTKEQVQETKTERVQQWAKTRPALLSIENLMSFKRAKYMKDEDVSGNLDYLPSINDEGSSQGESNNGFEEKVCKDEILDGNVTVLGKESKPGDRVSPESFSPWKEELENLVCGGVPKDLRGEVLRHGE